MARQTIAMTMALGALGCLAAGDDGPIMAVELYWEDPDDPGDFGFCREAGVDTMEWELFDQDGTRVDGREERCADAIDVIEPRPGDYELEIQGYDDGELRWESTCDDAQLRVLRFDVVYDCDIEVVE